jgi:hypothetical protein
MEVLVGDVMYDIIFKTYSRDQHGWSFTVSPAAKHGFFDALVANREEAWQLKFDTLFKPSPLVIGASVGSKEPDGAPPDNPFPFGFRELHPSWVERLGARDEGVAMPRQLAALLAAMKPVVPQPGRAYAQGPFVLSGMPSVALTKSAADVDERLSSEMLKLVRNRYPGYG